MIPQVQSNLNFNNPFFVTLIPFAVILVFLISVLTGRLQRRMVTAFGKRKTLEGFSRLRGARLRNAFWLAFALSCLLFALAKPSMSYGSRRTEQVFNHVAVFDASDSMRAEDYPGETSRIEMARRCVSRLYEAYPKGAVGLVLFTNWATSYDVTTDLKGNQFMVRYGTDPRRVRGAGSDLKAGVEEALELIESSAYTVKTIILLSDGGDTNPAELWGIVSLLKEARVRVISVGLGGDKLVRIPNRDPETGEIIGYRRFGGDYALTKLNKVPLVALAEATGGEYLRPWKGGEQLVQTVRRGGYATDVLLGEEEETNFTRWPLAFFLLVLASWMIDKRFFQG